MRAVAAVVCVALLSCTSEAPTAVRPPASGPNIIVVMTDDQDTSIAVMTKLQQRLQAQGITFLNSFVTTSLCCPSRVSFLRGQYAHNHTIFENTPPNGGWARAQALGLEQSTIAVWLHAAGYNTAYFGKYLNGYSYQETARIPGWSHWMGTRYGYYVPFNVDGKIERFGSPGDSAAYTTDVLSHFAGLFVGRAAQPFFVVVAPYAPHNTTANTPPTPAARHAGTFASLTLPESPSFNEADVGDKPSALNLGNPLTAGQIATETAMYRGRQESLLAVDELVDHLITVLDSTQRLSNTYIFYTSDNGFHLGQHRRQYGKNSPYEEDVRVPLLVRGPGIPQGISSTALVLNIDLAPTIAELAGVTTPAWVDGTSLVPLLLRGGASPRRRFATEHYNPATGWFVESVRSSDSVMNEWRKGGVLEHELYDLGQDPYELTNVYNNSPTAQHGMWPQWLSQLETCAGVSCEAAEDGP
jgi:N-acetylglucosamine-6-sulfatase